MRIDEDGDRELVFTQWGLLPFWWKPSDKTPKRTSFQRKCINVVAEEAHAKPSYREALKRRRCLLPASEFTEQVGKREYFFHLPDFRTFAIAGLWESWRGGDGEIVESCAMLTTTANKVVRSAGHDRMPVLLTDEQQYAAWLNPETTEREPLMRLFASADPAGMSCYPGGV